MRMEAQAKRTDRAIKQLGLTTDMVGTPRQQRQIQGTDRSLQSYGRTIDQTGGRIRGMNRDLDQHERRWKGVENRLVTVAKNVRSLGIVFGLLKIPAMGAGIGVLVQAVGALGGGIVGLIPQVVDLGGTFAALGPTVVGLGLAMVTTKLAFGDFSKALGGNKQALQQLTPQARQFLQTLHMYRPVLRTLRESAQAGIFSGLDFAIRRIQRGAPVANQLLQGMSRTLGSLARQAATRFTTAGFLNDLFGIGQAGTRGVSRIGAAILNLISGFRHLTVAAIPFTDWLTKGLVALSKHFERWAQFERDSGRFSAFLDRTRKSLRLFGQILGNLYHFIQGIGHAARPLGEMLWKDVDRATASWSKYANSLKGQLRLTEQFVSMHEAIKQIVTLFDNIVRAVFQMGSSPGLPKVVRSLSKLVPILQNILTTMANTWGPVIADGIAQIAKLLQNLVGATGPITIILTLLDKTLKIVNKLIGAVPGFGRVMEAALSVTLIGVFLGKLGLIEKSWYRIGSAAKVAAAAEAVAAGGAGIVGGAAAGATGAAGAFVKRGGAYVWEPAAEGAVAGGLLGRGVAAARGAGLRGALRGAGLAARGYAPLIVPAGVVLASNAAQQYVGGSTRQGLGIISNLAIGAGAGFAFGGPLGAGVGAALAGGREAWKLAQGDQTGIGGGYGKLQQSLTDRLNMAGANVPNPTLGQLRNQQSLLRDALTNARAVSGEVSGSVKDEQQYVAWLKQELSVRRSILQTVAQQRAEQSKARAAQLLRQFGGALDIYSGKYGLPRATQMVTAGVLGQLPQLAPAGRRQLAQQYLLWLQDEKRRHPELVGQYDKLQKQITGVFARLGTNIKIIHGRIITGTKDSWAQVRKAMGNEAEKAAEVTNKQFTFIQARAVSILEAMGLSPAGARAYVQSLEPGTPGGALPIPSALQGAGGDGTRAGAGDAPAGATGGHPHASGGNPTWISRTVALGRQLQGMGFRVGENDWFGGVYPVHAKNSYHYIDQALDINADNMPGGEQKNLDRLYRWLKPRIAQLGISQLIWRAPGHWDHLHVALGAGTGGRGTYYPTPEGLAVGGATPPSLPGSGGAGVSGAPGAANIPNAVPGMAGATNIPGATPGMRPAVVPYGLVKPGTTGVRGLPGLLADQAGRFLAAGVTMGLNQQLAQGGGMATATPVGGGGGATAAGALAAGAGGGGTPTANMKLGYAMMLARGLPASEWPSLRSLWQGESSWNANAVNPSSGAAGIPQALGHGHVFDLGDARAQIAWGLDYIIGRYHTPSAAYQSWLARSPHWYGEGGDFVARRPMMIGVGEKGEERVTITPKGRGGSGRAVQLHVNIAKVEYNADGDLRKVVHQEFERLARDIELLPIDWNDAGT